MPHPLTAAEVLDAAQRCALVGRGRTGLAAAAAAFWWDGAGLWLAVPADGPVVAALRAEPACVVCVPAVDDAGSAAVVTGTARVHGLHDPLGLAVHAGPVSAAMTALAARNAVTLAAAAQDASRSPARRLPRNLVAVRVGVDGLRLAAPPPAVAGVAPALPAVVPADVRRALAGCRQVTLAVAAGAGVAAAPATWGAGYTLEPDPGLATPAGAEAAVLVEAGRSAGATGVALHGVLDVAAAGPLLRAHTVVWWQGLNQATAPVGALTSGVTLPE